MSRSLILSVVLFAAAGGDVEPDHVHARAASARGDFVPLETILQDVERRVAGRVLSVEFDDGEYEIEVLREDGVLVELEYDARTGAFDEMDIEEQDD